MQVMVNTLIIKNVKKLHFDVKKHLTKLTIQKMKVKDYKKIHNELSCFIISKNNSLLFETTYDQTASLFLIFSAIFKMSVIIPLEIACLHAEAL